MPLNIFAFILLLVALQPPLDDGTFPLQQHLFSDFRGCTFYGRDVFSLIAGQAWLYWRNTGETPGSFLRLAVDLLPSLSHLTVHGRPRISQRRQKISLINQVLLVLMWLRKYPHEDTLSLFGLTLIRHLLFVLCTNLYQNFGVISRIKLVGPIFINGQILWEIGQNSLMQWAQ